VKRPSQQSVSSIHRCVPYIIAPGFLLSHPFAFAGDLQSPRVWELDYYRFLLDTRQISDNNHFIVISLAETIPYFKSNRNGLSQQEDVLIRRIFPMDEKKKKQESTRNVYKVLAVVGCVLFVVLMVVSSMGSGWITSLHGIQPGETVTIDFTIRDARGDPLVTTDQQLYQQVASKGQGIYFSKQLSIQANQSSKKAVIPIPVYLPDSGWTKTFALFGGESDAISQGIVGMKTNEQKSISIPFHDSMTQTWSATQLKSNGVNLTDIQTGDMIAMGVSDTPELEKNSTASTYSIRIGEVTKKSSDGVVINFGYPTIDVRVVSISNR
jgi:hypothetical protein